MIINVDASGSRHAFEVNASDKVEVLLWQVISKGIPARGRRLEYRDRVLDDDETFSHYGIREGDTVQFVRYCKGVHRAARGSLLSVATDSGNVTKMVVDEESSVREVRDVAARDAGVSASKLQLIAGGVEMQEDRRLKDYDITGDAVVWMEVEGKRKGRAGGSGASHSSEAGWFSACSVI
nr:uncharacterized protein LOC113822833 isoform X2 [Penaeus vannamei]